MQSFRDAGIHRHWQAQTRCFSIRYQKIPHLDWGVGLLFRGLQLPVVSLKFWDRIRQVSHLITCWWQGLANGPTTNSANDMQQRRWHCCALCLFSVLLYVLLPVLSHSALPTYLRRWRLCLILKKDWFIICASLILVTTDCAKCLWIHVVSVTGCWNTAGLPSCWRTQLFFFPPSSLFIMWWDGIHVIRPYALAGPK